MRSTISTLPNGLGFGHGTISKASRLKGQEVTEDILSAARKMIYDPASFPLVEFGDDGCGDGRETIATYKKEVGNSSAIDGARRVYRRPGQRAKVFGGGLMMAWIMDRVLRGEPKKGETAIADRKEVAQKLVSASFLFGGHTDYNAQGENCGCGAIDKSADILEAASTYRDEIGQTLKVVMGEQFDSKAYRRVLERSEALSENEAYMQDAKGAETRDILERSGAVIKELGGTHNEVFVILNYVPGTTFNQAKLNALTGSNAQAFAVDVWRIAAYGDLVSRWFDGEDDAYALALHAGLVYTLAAAAVLTDGSQEIFIRVPEKLLMPAL